MKVTLINYTPNPEETVAAAARLCYSPVGAEDLLKKGDQADTLRFLDMLIKMGHLSPTEHVAFTFAIEGVSRALTHQLVRHRIASYSQQSQRYVSENEFEYILPPSIEADEQARKIFIEVMEDIQKAYNKLGQVVPKEDARYLLPNACETKVVLTFNCRSLYNFFHHRCCERAQWEIRELAEKMLFTLREVAPNLFKHAGPRCLQGACPEGKMTCGKLKQVREKYASLEANN